MAKRRPRLISVSSTYIPQQRTFLSGSPGTSPSYPTISEVMSQRASGDTFQTPPIDIARWRGGVRSPIHQGHQ